MTHARGDQEEEFMVRQSITELFDRWMPEMGVAYRRGRAEGYRDGLLQGLILGATAIGIAWGVLG
jgi:hypothetical protein